MKLASKLKVIAKYNSESRFLLYNSEAKIGQPPSLAAGGKLANKLLSGRSYLGHAHTCMDQPQACSPLFTFQKFSYSTNGR